MRQRKQVEALRRERTRAEAKQAGALVAEEAAAARVEAMRRPLNKARARAAMTSVSETLSRSKRSKALLPICRRKNKRPGGLPGAQASDFRPQRFASGFGPSADVLALHEEYVAWLRVQSRGTPEEEDHRVLARVSDAGVVLALRAVRRCLERGQAGFAAEAREEARRTGWRPTPGTSETLADVEAVAAMYGRDEQANLSEAKAA
jgi:hypothetical protein